METRSSANDVDPIPEAEGCQASTKCSSSSSSSQPDDTLQWVQCENPNCLKWRSLSKEEVQNLDIDAPWFCHMNKDILHSSCDDPEENYNSSLKLKRHGLSYTYSLLPEGSIIWAKLPGYCKWPAVLCSSPASSDYFVLDHDGDPYSYHVEFLGTKHSIAWVHHEKITAYGNLGKQEALETCSQPISQVSMNRFRHKTKKRKRSILAPKKKISVQLSEQLQKAIDEADDLIEMGKEEVLSSCYYRYKPTNQAKPDEFEDKPKVSESDSKARKRKKDEKSKKKKKEGKCKNSNSIELLLSNSQLSNHAIGINKLSDFQSKEERLMADIKGLEKREMEFVDDYTTFMKQKGEGVKTPKWFGVSVKLFQLYMAVQERGGFDQVCSNSLWKNIVVECCDITTNKLSSSAASTAMTFYSRRLLPYEMHIKDLLPKSAVGNEEMLFTAAGHSEFFPPEPAPMGEDEALKELEEIEALLENDNDGVGVSGDDDQACETNTEPVTSTCETPQADNRETPRPASQDQPSVSDKVHCGIAFRDLAPSQVFTEMDGNNGTSEPEDMVDSDEDLFAEISRDEELLQSFLSAQ